MQGGHADPAGPQAQVGPAQAVLGLGAQHQIQAAAERVAVDKEGAAAGVHGGDADRDGEHGRAGAAPPTEYGQRPAGGPSGCLGDVGQGADQPGLGLGEHDDLLNADAETLRVERVRRALGAHEYDGVAAREAEQRLAELGREPAERVS